MVAGLVCHYLRAHIGLAKCGQNADGYQFSIQCRGVLVDSPDRCEQLLLCSGKRRSLESLGAEVVFEIEAVELNRELGILNAGGNFCVDGLNTEVRIYDVELNLGANGARSLAKAGPVQKTSECLEVCPDLGRKTLKLFWSKFCCLDRQSHGNVFSSADLP